MAPPVALAPGAQDKSYRWLFAFVRAEALPLATVVVLSVVVNALSLAQPLITRYLIDRGLLGGDMRLIVKLCALMVLLGVLALQVALDLLPQQSTREHPPQPDASFPGIEPTRHAASGRVATPS